MSDRRSTFKSSGGKARDDLLQHHTSHFYNTGLVALEAYDSAQESGYMLPVGRATFAGKRVLSIGPELVRTADGNEMTLEDYAVLPPQQRAARFSDVERARAERLLAERRRHQQREMDVDAPRPSSLSAPSSLFTERLPLPVPVLDGDMLLSLLRNARTVTDQMGDVVLYWRNHRTYVPRLADTLADPARIQALLVQMPIKDVHAVALGFVTSATAVEELREMYTHITEGIARRYSSVANAHDALWRLCYSAIKHRRPYIVRQLLQRSPERGVAVIDLAIERVDLLNSFSGAATDADRQLNDESLRVLLDWRGPVGERAVVSSESVLESSILRNFDDIMLLTRLVARRGMLAAMYSLALETRPNIFVISEDDRAALRVALLNTPIDEDAPVKAKLDLSVILPLLAEYEVYYTQPIAILEELRRWRGAGGAYIDFSKIFASQLGRAQFKSSSQSDTLREGEVDSARLLFYLNWRSPDSSRYVDVTDEDILEKILRIKIREFRREVMDWRSPARDKRVSIGQYLYTLVRCIEKFTPQEISTEYISALAHYATRPDNPVSVHSETQVRLMLVPLLQYAEKRDVSDSVAQILHTILVSIPGQPNMPCNEWLMRNGGEHIFELTCARLPDVIHLYEQPMRRLVFVLIPRRSLADTMVLYARVMFRHRARFDFVMTENHKFIMQYVGVWNQLSDVTRASLPVLNTFHFETGKAHINAVARELLSKAQTMRTIGDPPFSIDEILEDTVLLP